MRPIFSLLCGRRRARRDRAVLDAFFLNVPDGFAFLDADLRVLRANAPFAEFVGAPAGELVGLTVRDAAPLHADALEPLLRRVLELEEAAVGLELCSGDGRRHALASFYPVTGRDGVLGVGAALTDVTQLKEAERRLAETNRRLAVLATTDELTGLPNRRMLAEQLELAVARARRGGLAVGLLALDLDRFKDVNDSLGHAYGDQLLAEVAGRLRAGARATDVVARFGGDEFVVLLADLDVQAAPELVASVAERIHGLLAEPVSIGPVELRADASAGIALYPFDARDADGLLAAADAAMYVRKTAVAGVSAA